MRNPRRCAPLSLVLALGFLTSSCLWTHRVILRRGKPVTPGAAPPLLDASKEELNSRITNLYNAINSFQATVQMTPSVGSVYKGQITDIKNIKAFILFRKPNDIRMIGQLPVVGTKEFDMVSLGDTFKFLEVSRNLFFIGSNDTPPTSKSALENLRPEAFLSSMLIRPANPPTEHPVLEDETDEEGALYVLHFIRGRSIDSLLPGRSVWFDRVDFSLDRQLVYDDSGSIVSDTRYSRWQTYDGVRFPSHIDINRPKDGYGVTMEIQEMKMNIPLTDEKFELSQPEGSQLRRVGEPK